MAKPFAVWPAPMKRREDAGGLPNAVRIDGRPAIVDSRRRSGDWEGDTIVGRGHRGGLLSLVERKSGFTLLARVNDRRAATVRAAAEEHLAELPEALRRTVTFDNGKEFAEQEQLSAATGHRAAAAIRSSLNDRPRKRHDYRTPREVLQHGAHRRGVAIGT